MKALPPPKIKSIIPDAILTADEARLILARIRGQEAHKKIVEEVHKKISEKLYEEIDKRQHSSRAESWWSVGDSLRHHNCRCHIVEDEGATVSESDYIKVVDWATKHLIDQTFSFKIKL